MAKVAAGVKDAVISSIEVLKPMNIVKNAALFEIIFFVINHMLSRSAVGIIQQNSLMTVTVPKLSFSNKSINRCVSGGYICGMPAGPYSQKSCKTMPFAASNPLAAAIW